MLSDKTINILKSLDQQIGEGWFYHALAADAVDDLLHVITADGVFTTKIDGFIHAANMTTPFLVKHIAEMEERQDNELNLERMTSWRSSDSATRFAQWQVDFHWKIDTRLWHYLLYIKFMRRAYHDAIRSVEGIVEEERVIALDGNVRFWDAVEIAYCYRQEMIERSRHFAPHPDATAGANAHGYTYRAVVPKPNYQFSHLRFELIGPELGAGTERPEQVPVGFPRVPQLRFGELTEAARNWVATAQIAGLCDRYLRARLGDRWVPTRLNGWEAALTDLCRYIAPSDNDPLFTELGDIAATPRTAEIVTFFVQTQIEFGRRLNRLEHRELLALIDTAGEALRRLVPGSSSDGDLVTAFRDAVQAELDTADTGTLPAHYLPLVDLVRPIHPRYAAQDPLEPLPWHTRNPDRYAQRMRRLGYEL